MVRRKGLADQTRTSPTKTAAKTWADRIEREMADLEARGGARREEITIAELIAWRMEALSSVEAVSKTQAGNMTICWRGWGI